MHRHDNHNSHVFTKRSINVLGERGLVVAQVLKSQHDYCFISESEYHEFRYFNSFIFGSYFCGTATPMSSVILLSFRRAYFFKDSITAKLISV